MGATSPRHKSISAKNKRSGKKLQNLDRSEYDVIYTFNTLSAIIDEVTISIYTLYIYGFCLNFVLCPLVLHVIYNFALIFLFALTTLSGTAFKIVN